MNPYYTDDQITLHLGDALDVTCQLPSGAVDCIVTSPPYYGLRDYGTDGQYGLEESPQAYVETMRALFAELRRVLADDGTLWLNIGDSYSSEPPGKTEHAQRSSTLQGCGGASAVMRESVRTAAIDRTKFMPRKNLMGIPWRVAFALQDDGWILRNAIIWHKPNAMPESITDRLSGRYEHVFMFSKARRYWFDLDPIREQYDGERTPSRRARSGLVNKPNSIATPWDTHTNCSVTGERHTGAHDLGRNPGDVWNIPTAPFAAAHFAVMPVQLAQRCILAGCKPGGTVLDPFSGSGTTGLAAQRTGRKYIGIDLSREYLELSLRTRLNQSALNFGTTA